jgi:ribonuclease HIII
MSDPKTADFLEKNFEVHKELFRKSWMPYRKMADRKNQMKLGSFSKSIEKVENKDKGLLDKLKKLEHLGYESIPVKTPYESVRLKGACTITLYKSGKLLVQGKEKDKKVIESILGKK